MATTMETGTYVGTGAAINVQLGFIPEWVRVVNITDGDDIWEWFTGMTDGHAIYQRSVVDNATTGNASISRITANGISALPGDRTTPVRPGFTVGTALSESGDTFRWVALRSAGD